MARTPRLDVGFSTSSATGPGASAASSGSIAGAEIGQAQPLRLGGRLGPDLQHEARVGVRADPRQRARCGLEREAGGIAGLQKRQPAQRRADRVQVGLAVRPAPLAHALEREHVVERVERLRTMVADGADLGRDAEVDRDEVIHRRLVLVVTLRAAEAAQDGAQAGKALDRAGAPRADQEPVHLEQPERGGVQEQIDRLALVEAALARERERVDAKERRVVIRPDQRLQARDDARAPGPRRLQPGEPLIEHPLVDQCRHRPASLARRCGKDTTMGGRLGSRAADVARAAVDPLHVRASRC